MEDYKSNSHKSKLENAKDETNSVVEKKEIKPITQGKARKRSGITKAAENFVNEDMQNVKNYVVGDVLIPALKKAISDVVTNGIDMILYHGEHPRRDSRSSNISYYKYSDRESRDDRRGTSLARAGYSHDDVVLDSRAEAEEVLTRLDELIDTYGVASVADLYDLVGISCAYTDNKYGWTNLRNADISRVRDGYLLKLPRATVID